MSTTALDVQMANRYDSRSPVDLVKTNCIIASIAPIEISAMISVVHDQFRCNPEFTTILASRRTSYDDLPVVGPRC